MLRVSSVLLLLAMAVWPLPARARAVEHEPDVVFVCAPTSSDRGPGILVLELQARTGGEVSREEAAVGRPLLRPHPETGTCADPAGLPVSLHADRALLDAAGVRLDHPWLLCAPGDDVPQWIGSGPWSDLPPIGVDPKSGTCPPAWGDPSPHDPVRRAAAMAAFFSLLEATGDADSLYDWLHPDAKALVPRTVVHGWLENEVAPRRPQPIEVERVRFVDWTWPVTGKAYRSVAEVAYRQRFADGSVEEGVLHLVPDGEAWRWLFGPDRAWVEEQIARYRGVPERDAMLAMLPRRTAPWTGSIPVVDEGMGNPDAIAATFPDPAAAARLMAEWGWRESVFRVFAGWPNNAGGEHRYEVSIHRFADAAGAASAVPYFASARAEALGLVIALAAGGPPGQVMIGGEEGDAEASLYAAAGPLLVRVTAENEPWARSIMDGVLERSAPDPPQPDGAGSPVCVFARQTDYWPPVLRVMTPEEIAEASYAILSVVPVNSETGICLDPSGLPVETGPEVHKGYLTPEDIAARFPAFTCWRDGDARWNGPGWDFRTSMVPIAEYPPDPVSGGCQEPKGGRTADRYPATAAAAFAAYFSVLAAKGDADLLYDWMHPDARVVVPREAVRGWYDEEVLPKGPQPVRVEKVEFVDWTWGVTGVTYGSAAEVSYSQRFADGTETRGVAHLVRDGDVWRWFFGDDPGWVNAQVVRHAPGWRPPSAASLLPTGSGRLPAPDETVPLDQAVRAFGDPAEAADLLGALGWAEAARHVVGYEDSIRDPGGRATVTVHRFATAVGAARGAEALVRARLATAGLQEAEPWTVGPDARLLVGDPAGRPRFLVVAHRGQFLVEVASQGSDWVAAEARAYAELSAVLESDHVP